MSDFLNKITQNIPVVIYTDGACSGNPGPGGWGALLKQDDLSLELSGGDPATTNNRMEMLAAIEAVQFLPHGIAVEIYTDSAYLKDGMQSWLANWKKRGWKTATGQPVKNQDLWQKLDALNQTYKIAWHWIKGHAGHPGNERADALARNAIISLKVRLA